MEHPYLPEIHKTQWVRLYFDTLFLGPFLVWVAWKCRNNLNQFEKAGMVLGGIGTMVYNYRNYLREKEYLEQGGFEHKTLSPFSMITYHHPVSSVIQKDIK